MAINEGRLARYSTHIKWNYPSINEIWSYICESIENIYHSFYPFFCLYLDKIKVLKQLYFQVQKYETYITNTT